MFRSHYYNYLTQIKTFISKNNKIIVLVGICIFWIWLFFSTKLVFSGFHFIDDHEIVNIYYDIHQQKMSLWDVIVKWINHDHNVGRFRPFFYIHRVIEAKIFGLNWFLWFSYRCLLASLTTYLLFIFGGLINLSIWESLLFAFLTVLGEQTITWWRLGVAESIGMFLISTSLLFGVLASVQENRKKIYNILFCITLILASLVKESFIIFIPSIIAVKIWIPCVRKNIDLNRSIKSDIKIISIIFFLLFSEILYIKFFIGTNVLGYAGIDKDTLNPTKIISVISSIMNNSLLFVIITVFVCFVLYSFLIKKLTLSKYIFQQILLVISVFLLSIVPQIFLYTKSGISGFYLLPALIGTSLFTIVIIHFIGQYSQPINLLLIAFLFIITFNKLSSVSFSMNNFALEGISTNNLFNKIELCSKNQDKNKILIVVNPRLSYEISKSIKKYFNYSQNIDNFLIATYGLEGTDFYSETHKETEKFWSFIDPKDVVTFYNNKTITGLKNKNSIKGVVIFSLKEDFVNTSKEWFSEKTFIKDEYILNYMGQNVTFYCKKN